MNKLIAGLMTAGVMLSGATLVGCNTLEGAGKDVERAGEKIQDANCTKGDKASDPNCTE